MNYDRLTTKKQTLDAFKPLDPVLTKNLADWFLVELTYTSNAIEGNTLTRAETALIIEKGLAVGGKTLREHLEATNYACALDYVDLYTDKKISQLTVDTVLNLHRIVLKGIDDDHAGCYRNGAVRIAGSTVIMPNPLKIPDLMNALVAWLTHQQDMHPVALASEVHYRLVSIHPFIDGNGRTARLLMNMLLAMHGYPPAIIRKQDRLAYINALEQAQLGGSKTHYEQIIFKAVERSLDIYLKALNGESTFDKQNTDKLFKIGELAQHTKEAVSTIRHWTKIGLLEIAEVTPAGYQLFSSDMIKRCKEIKTLQAKRLTLEEIKTTLFCFEHLKKP